MLTPATSDPTSGSVIPRAMVISPCRYRGRISALSSSVPTARMTLATISVVLMATVGASAFVSS